MNETPKKIRILEYFSEYGMASDVASITELSVTQIRSAIYNLRKGKNILPRTQRLIFEGVNRREGGKLSPQDIIWNQ